MKEKGARRWIDLVLLALLPFVTVLVVAAEHYGVFDRWRGLEQVEQVSARFDESYAPDASRPVYPGDPAWNPMITLIKKYSTVKLRSDRLPETIARMRATLSTDERDGFEWTSPSTPFVVFYVRWPQNTGKGIPSQDFTVVGTIGQLQEWIAQSKDDFHFLINDILLGLVPVALGLCLWRMNYLHRHRRTT